MTDPREQYTREIFSSLGYIATWLPGVPVRLGDVGVFKGTFEHVTSLRNLDIAFSIRADETSDQINYASKGAVSVSFKAAGKAPMVGSALAVASAGVTVKMERENAILIQALECRSPSIEDQVNLGRTIALLHRKNKWDLDYFVVTEVLEARSATILIASGSDACIELKAAGKVGAENFKIADARAGFGIVHSRNVHTEIVAAEGLTPMFKARRLKPRLFGSPLFRGNGEMAFDELTPADLE